MLRTKFVKTAALFLTAAIVLGGAMPARAGQSEELYLDALGETYTAKVETTLVERGDFVVNSSCRGHLDYANVYYVFNETNYGNVKFGHFFVNNGQYVTKGEPIAEVTVDVESVDLDKLWNEIMLKEENYSDYADTNNILLKEYERIMKESASAEERRNAQLLYERLEVEFKREKEKRENELDELYNRYNNYESVEPVTYITAPGDGYVYNINRYRQGDSLGAYSYMCFIVDASDVKVYVNGGNELFRYGMNVEVAQGTGPYEVSVPGTITTNNSPTLSTSLIGADDIILLDGDTSVFEIGTEVTIKFKSVEMNNVLLVSKKAVYNDTNGDYVYLYKDGRSIKQYILTGGSNSESVYVVDGLDEGDAVVIK